MDRVSAATQLEIVAQLSADTPAELLASEDTAGAKDTEAASNPAEDIPRVLA